MKNIYFSLFITLLLASCSPESEELSQQQTQSELITYKIALGGELNMSESPLKSSRNEKDKAAANTSTNDLFGIQVYNDSGNPYAYVLGDDISRITLELEEDEEYEIQVTYIKNGKDILFEYVYEKFDYGLPFFTANYGEAIKNKVYYGGEDYLMYLGSNSISGTNDIIHQQHTPADRYYNAIPFTALGEDREISLDLKRVSLGVDVELDLGEDAAIEQVLFTPQGSGSSEIQLADGKGALGIPYLTLQGDGSLRAMDKVIKEGHQENFTFQLTTEENGQVLYSGSIEVKRNTRYKLKISNEVPPSSGNISITLEAEDMKEESITISPEE